MTMSEAEKLIHYFICDENCAINANQIKHRQEFLDRMKRNNIINFEEESNG